MTARLRVGLTGGIGSGKSTVGARLRACGAGVIDADAIARAVTGPGGTAMPAIAAMFGPAVVADNGGLNRAAMRALAFADTAARRQLETIVHPLVRTEIDAAIRAAAEPIVVLDIPLLVESGSWTSRVDRVLVVDLPVDQQIERVARSRSLPPPEVEAIIAVQATRAQRLAAADDVIYNGAAPEAVRSRVDRLYARYESLARNAAALPLPPGPARAV